jgi:hypothetical protein
MNAKEGFVAMAKDHANLFRQNNSLSNEWYPTKKRLQCEKLKRPDLPENDAGIGRLCLPIPGHLIKLQCIIDEGTYRRATVTVRDTIFTGHIGAALWQPSPKGGCTESLIAHHRAPGGGRLGVVERQV